MILFLYGEDSYRARAKLAAIREKFLAKYPIDNLTRLPGGELTVDGLPALLLAQTLLGGSRLIVLEEVLSEASSEVKAALAKLLPTLPAEITAVICETQTFDRRQALFKLLNRPGQAEEFIPLKGMALRRVAQELASARGVQLTPANLEVLLARVGSDLWRLRNELAKLAGLTDGQPVTRTQIEMLVEDSLATNVFQLVAAGLSKDSARAHAILARTLLAGEDEVRTLGALAYQLRNLIRIHDLRAAGKTVAESVQLTHLPPFAVQANWPLVGRCQRAQVVGAYRQLALADWQVKTGVCLPGDALELLTLKLSVT